MPARFPPRPVGTAPYPFRRLPQGYAKAIHSDHGPQISSLCQQWPRDWGVGVLACAYGCAPDSCRQKRSDLTARRLGLADQGKDRPPARTLADALIELSEAVSRSWNRPLRAPLKRSWRFTYAFAGSFPWIFYNFDRDWIGTSEAIGLGFTILSLIAQMVVAGWFAWLISFQKRPCSPSRLFLEGLLFPGIAAALISGSFLNQFFGG